MRPNPTAPPISHAAYLRELEKRKAKYAKGTLYQQQVEGGAERRLTKRARERTAVVPVEEPKPRRGRGVQLARNGNREQRAEQRARREAEAAKYGTEMSDGTWTEPPKEAVEERAARGRAKAAEQKRAATALRKLATAVATPTPDTQAAPRLQVQGELFTQEAA